MKKVFTAVLLLVAFNLVSCGDDDPDSEPVQQIITDSNIYIQDSLCLRYFGKGYSEMNVDELRMLGEYVPEYGSSLKSWVSFSGFKDNKRWTVIFEKDSRKKILEYQDKEDFNRMQSIYLGYGESMEVEVTDIYSRIIPMSDGYVLHLKHRCDNQYNYTELFYNGSSFFNQKGNIEIYPWYNNTFWYDRTVFNLKGEVRFTLDDSVPMSLVRGFYLPLNETECISWIHENKICRIDFQKLWFETEVWTYQLPNVSSNDRISISLTNVENDILTFVYDILHYDGSKEKKQVKININGEDLDKVVPIDI